MKKILLAFVAGLMYVSAFALDHNKHNVEFAYEHSKYTYREPHMAYPIKDYGRKNGASIKYTNYSLLSQEYDERDPSFGQIELRYMGGNVDYDGWMQYSNGTVEPSKSEGLKDYYFEAALKVGRTYYLARPLELAPYLGLGWRQLRNHAEEMGAGGYERTSTYVYMPIGLNLVYAPTESFSLTLNGQFDWLLRGNQYSRMTDIPGYLSDSSNRQDQGYGVRVSVKAAVNLSRSMGIFIEPFWRYWHIQNSNEQWYYYNADPTLPAFALIEPFNTTQEYGIRAGISF